MVRLFQLSFLYILSLGNRHLTNGTIQRRAKEMADIATANVAVVDDNPATLYSTSRILHAANFNVSEGINGEQALELAFKGIDILLLDANLPDIHGFDVCKQLRGDP